MAVFTPDYGILANTASVVNTGKITSFSHHLAGYISSARASGKRMLKSFSILPFSSIRRFLADAPRTWTYIFPFGLYVNADAEDMYFKYLSGAGTDNNVLRLKCSIWCYFLQHTLKVSLSAMDLLNRGSSYMTTSTSNYFKQEWKPTYGRYYMLTVVYEFRHKKG